MIPDRNNPAPARHEAGDSVAWTLCALLAVVGPLLAHGARDDEMYVFGLSLFGFALLFLFFEMKRHFDSTDRTRNAQAAAATRHE